MYGIICKKDGDPKISIPIVREEDDGIMATWDDINDARNFAEDHILCRMSSVIFIDLDNEEIR